MITECFLGKPPQNVEEYIFIKHLNPLCFTAVDAGAVVQLKCVGTNLKTQVFQTSTDKINWTDHSFDENGMLVNSENSTDFILLNIGDKIYFRAKNDNMGIARNASNYLQFKTTQNTKLVNVSGNLMSLLNPKFSNLNKVNEYQFYLLFENITNIKECGELLLPASQLSERCYAHMFSGCTSLISAPELPAETLAEYCYFSMFNRCTSLTGIMDILPAKILSNNCYNSMFFNCQSIIKAPELPAKTIAEYCYFSMFEGCKKMTQAPELPATQLTKGCYMEMFSRCSSLKTAPILPATTLVKTCYKEMFSSCSGINYIETNHERWIPSNATQNWVLGVASRGTFKCPSMLAQKKNENLVPYGWSVETK